ncbi:4082_t:CDS:2, partial [Paraglomus occultum]
LSSHQAIALYLILEKSKGIRSPWYEYIKVLPERFDIITSNMIDFLPGNVRVDLERQKEKFERDYAAIKQLQATSNAYGPISSSEFLWGWLCVNTRCIYFKASNSQFSFSSDENIAIAPMLDFLNHSSSVKIMGEFNQQTKCYQITTMTTIKKGEEVFINYGPHDNFRLLIEYGFTIPNNSFNYVSMDEEFLSLSLPDEDDAAKQYKLKILTQTGFMGDYTLREKEISFRLLTALRLRVLHPFIPSSAHAQSLIACWKDTLIGRLDKISEENDQLVFDYLERMCQTALNKADIIMNNLSREMNRNGAFHIYQIWDDSVNILKSIVDLCQCS